MNLIEKYLAKAAGKEHVAPGQDLTCKVSFVAAHDVTAPIAIRMFREIGVKKVFDPSRVALIVDHVYPAATEKARANVWAMDDFSKEFGVPLYQRGEGVIHQLMYEISKGCTPGLAYQQFEIIIVLIHILDNAIHPVMRNTLHPCLLLGRRQFFKTFQDLVIYTVYMLRMFLHQSGEQLFLCGIIFVKGSCSHPRVLHYLPERCSHEPLFHKLLYGCLLYELFCIASAFFHCLPFRPDTRCVYSRFRGHPVKNFG